MTKRKKPGRRLLFLAALSLAAISIIGAAVFSKVEKLQKREYVTSIPRVFSLVKNLEVIGVTAVRTESPAAGIAVQIRNNSGLAVMAVDLVAGEGGLTKNGLTDEEHPIVVIEPYGTTVVEMSFSEMTPGTPLVVSAATYADGTEVGDASSLDSMHKVRAHDKAKRLAEKKGSTVP